MTDEQRQDKQQAFLAAYEETANVLTAAKLVGIDRSMVYYWQEHDEQFALAFHQSDAAANLNIEAEIRRRAIEGWEEPLASAGKLLGTVRKYSDTLLIFYAKRRMPEYREKQQLDVTANVTTTSTQAAELRLLTDDQLEMYESWLLAAKARQDQTR